MTVKLTVAGVDVTKWTDRADLQLLDEDLGNALRSIAFVLEDDPILGAIPVRLLEGLAIAAYADDGVTQQFGGKIAVLAPQHVRTRLRWKLQCQSHEARLLEMTTGALDRSATIDTDRNHVIAIMQSALQAQTFASATIDDSIYTVNASNWTGVSGTAAIAGKNWSNKRVRDCLADVLKMVPNVSWRLKPDQTVLYAPIGITPAPFVVASMVPGQALPAGVVPMEKYSESTYLADHRNKMSRGGAGGSTATAYDEASYAQYGLILADPFSSDATIPSADLRRLTYAELATRRVKTTAGWSVTDDGLDIGQQVDVVDQALGEGAIPVPWPEATFALMARSDSGFLAQSRGQMVIQKLHREQITPGVYRYQVEASDWVRDFETTVVQLAAAAQ